MINIGIVNIHVREKNTISRICCSLPTLGNKLFGLYANMNLNIVSEIKNPKMYMRIP